ncbi:hypothetical protein GLAREA_12418 [Glarea lozoyensis ATCC 20868]|uniref:Modin n=1 Tax=Glarea lozoyensis (strain ATCC 20868 / MF5171) TaxID=1116229 RepID=S3CZG1_GLAL2|nr:uncharacterized protein GLAREA_12418 [Glarea lozoyensis ATCC 20868]EPE31662.1 hypothetical protein GLAREA_12418 [Glarea lozoyensis ATCC 20868]
MGGFDSVNQNVFGLTALVVSLVALVTTVLQVLQQYFSSAEGYRRCARSVMGAWSSGTHRKLVAREFRVEVVFETPVILVAPPTNKKGPIAGRPIYYIDGTDESYRTTRVLKRDEQDAHIMNAAARVHTADDERASWVTLLSALQTAEEDSRKWDDSERRRTPPKNNIRIPVPFYEIAVGLQSKTRSWDFIPSSITKPYATTAICHMVEMMAMLGVYWKVFDQIMWNLRAEGNGYILTSTSVHGLGVMVVFAVTGKSNFTERRVIPCSAVKELAFGTVPNIFSDNDYLLKNADAQILQLEFGTPEVVATTLESLGCTQDTLARWGRDHKHIFSVSFELIGMLGKSFRIRGSNFRMLPNPTTDFWAKMTFQKPAWKVTRLMEVFQEKLTELIKSEGLHGDHEIVRISRTWADISGLKTGADDDKIPLDVCELIHDALDDRTAYLLNTDINQTEILSVIVAHLAKVMEVLEDQNSKLNNIVLANKEDELLTFYFYYVRPAVVGNLDPGGKPLSRTAKETRNTVWISLVFRMLCWLLLHDFDRQDVRVVPTDMKGSRMPIYIG